MGKDGDRTASSKSKQSKDDLKQEHVDAVQREKELTAQFTEVKAIFKKLDECYQISKGIFSIQRYGQLKDMIKDATSDATISSIKQTVASANQGKGGSLTGLMSKAKQFSASGETEAQSSQTSQASGATKTGKLSSFMKKMKKVTGFSDDPVTDEDVMSERELQRDTGRKQRAIQHHITQFSKALATLEKLKEEYQSSKAHAPPKRYMELKDMIKTAVAEKL